MLDILMCFSHTALLRAAAIMGQHFVCYTHFMKIKKIGHCCLLIQVDGLTILTDPGSYSVDQNTITNIDVVLITHEHGDHLHVGSVKEILKNNPEARVITNSGVGAILAKENIPYLIAEGRSAIEVVAGINLEAYDGRHEEIFEELGQVQNTGYFISHMDGSATFPSLFYPGDSYIQPGKAVDILALPVSGPWCKIPDALRYAIAVKPKKAFPVHDAMIKKEMIGGLHGNTQKVLGEHGIEFTAMIEGDEKEF